MPWNTCENMHILFLNYSIAFITQSYAQFPLEIYKEKYTMVIFVCRYLYNCLSHMTQQQATGKRNIFFFLTWTIGILLVLACTAYVLYFVYCSAVYRKILRMFCILILICVRGHFFFLCFTYFYLAAICYPRLPFKFVIFIRECVVLYIPCL